MGGAATAGQNTVDTVAGIYAPIARSRNGRAVENIWCFLLSEFIC